MVEPHPALDVCQADVGRQPILVAGAFADEVFEEIVADFAVPLGCADARLIHGLADHLGRWPVVGPPGRALEPGALAAHDRRQDARSCRRTGQLSRSRRQIR